MATPWPPKPSRPFRSCSTPLRLSEADWQVMMELFPLYHSSISKPPNAPAPSHADQLGHPSSIQKSPLPSPRSPYHAALKKTLERECTHLPVILQAKGICRHAADDSAADDDIGAVDVIVTVGKVSLNFLLGVPWFFLLLGLFALSDTERAVLSISYLPTRKVRSVPCPVG